MGLSDKLQEAFLNVVPVNRPEYSFNGITNPYWVAGFTSGDGSFHLLIRKSDSTKGKVSVSLRYSINLNIRDTEVIKGLATFFKTYGLSFIETEAVTNTEDKYNHYYILDQTVSLQITKLSPVRVKLLIQ